MTDYVNFAGTAQVVGDCAILYRIGDSTVVYYLGDLGSADALIQHVNASFKDGRKFEVDGIFPENVIIRLIKTADEEEE